MKTTICTGYKVRDFYNKLFKLDGAGKPKVWDDLDGVAIACALEGSEALAATLLKGCILTDPPRGKGPKNK